MFEVNIRDTKTMATVSLLLNLSIIHPFSSVSIVAFEQANVYWVLGLLTWDSAEFEIK